MEEEPPDQSRIPTLLDELEAELARIRGSPDGLMEAKIRSIISDLRHVYAEEGKAAGAEPELIETLLGNLLRAVSASVATKLMFGD